MPTFQPGDQVTVRPNYQNYPWYLEHNIRRGDRATVILTYGSSTYIKYDKLLRSYHLRTERHQLLSDVLNAGIRHRAKLAEQRGHLVTE